MASGANIMQANAMDCTDNFEGPQGVVSSFMHALLFGVMALNIM